MKVAIIGSRGIPARYGGFEVFADKLSQGLSQAGHKVFVYSLSEFDKVEYHYPNIKRVFVRAPNFSLLEKMFLSNFSILHCLFRERVDAIIFLGVSGALTMWLTKLSSAKTLLNIDGIEWRRSRWGNFVRLSLRTLERLAVRWTDVVIADSEAIGAYILSQYKRSFVFIPYGVDECSYTDINWMEVSSKYNLVKGEYYLIVGRHVPENNFDISIKGFLQTGSPKKLVIVSNLREADLKQDGKVIFAGPIYDRPKLYALRANASAYIHGHSVGGTNPSLLEAMSSRNLVLAYDVPYNREVLGDYGYYFKNEDDLTNLINFIETNYEKVDKNKILEYYDKILTEKYNWDSVVKKYEELLH